MLAIVAAPARAHAADDATAQARSHYEMGLKLFDAREHEQALIEFSKANEIKSRPAALFMMAQCEYLMGRLKDASIHYQRYATENPDGEFAELARDRVESIAKRLSTFVVNTVPEDVTVRISPEAETGKVVASGQAPNNFQIPRGRYRVDVTKPNYQGQTRIVDIDVGETKPLFFKLDPIPARLEIETRAAGRHAVRQRQPRAEPVPPGRHARPHRDLRRGDRLRREDGRSDAGAGRADAADRRRAPAAQLRAAFGAAGAGRRVVVAWRDRGSGSRHRAASATRWRARTSLRCCWWAAAHFPGAVAGALVGSALASRGTSPTTRRSSSWAGCGSGPPRD